MSGKVSECDEVVVDESHSMYLVWNAFAFAFVPTTVDSWLRTTESCEG